MEELNESNPNQSNFSRLQAPELNRLSVQFPLKTLSFGADLGVNAEELYDLMPKDLLNPSDEIEKVNVTKKRPPALNLNKKDEVLINWLSVLHLTEYYPNFEKHNITLDMLSELKKEDFKDLIPRVGDRIRAWKAVSGLLTTTSQPQEPQLPQKHSPKQSKPQVRSSRSGSGEREHKSSLKNYTPDPRFITVTFHTFEKKSLHVELLSTTQIISYVCHCAKIAPNTLVRIVDARGEVYEDDGHLRTAIVDLNIREFWLEPVATGSPGSYNRSPKPVSTPTSENSATFSDGSYKTKNSSNTSLGSAITATSVNSTASDMQVPVVSPATSHFSIDSQLSSAGTLKAAQQPSILVERPTPHEVTKRISEYFPHADAKQLQEGIRNSTIISNRLSTINLGNWRESINSHSTKPSLQGLDLELLEKLDNEDSNPTSWVKGKMLGVGSFGKVYYAFNISTGAYSAVKQIELNEHEENYNSMVESLRREISLLRKLHHENIVAYRGFNRVEGKLNIFLEYVSGGSLASKLAKSGPLDEHDIRGFTRQCLLGLAYLHERGIIHRDIKSANILVTVDQQVKISDFGLSKYEQRHSQQRYSMQGTVFWMAPEVVRGKEKTTTKADIWSLGCLIIEMITGEHPFPKLLPPQALYKIGVGTQPDIPRNISADLEDLIGMCLKLDPKERASAEDLLRHPFMTS